MKLYRCRERIVAENADRIFEIDSPSWDHLLAREDLHELIIASAATSKSLDDVPHDVLPPIGSQEVCRWRDLFP